MPPPESRKYLWDALYAAELVLQFTASKMFDDYQQDALLRSAVERQKSEGLPILISSTSRQTGGASPNVQRPC